MAIWASRNGNRYSVAVTAAHQRIFTANATTSQLAATFINAALVLPTALGTRFRLAVMPPVATDPCLPSAAEVQALAAEAVFAFQCNTQAGLCPAVTVPRLDIVRQRFPGVVVAELPLPDRRGELARERALDIARRWGELESIELEPLRGNPLLFCVLHLEPNHACSRWHNADGMLTNYGGSLGARRAVLALDQGRIAY